MSLAASVGLASVRVTSCAVCQKAPLSVLGSKSWTSLSVWPTRPLTTMIAFGFVALVPKISFVLASSSPGSLSKYPTTTSPGSPLLVVPMLVALTLITPYSALTFRASLLVNLPIFQPLGAEFLDPLYVPGTVATYVLLSATSFLPIPCASLNPSANS